ncbi:hypothetical protein FRX31_016703 [Thalictrum thalictroides]|uniref:Uncharacterized protein n=1 Tax=Thalictrum thalictroides TaxID=46969 RepID=A0A7J6W8V6_THATH|nr:hypothetical protein FRX31_016703 [Thalictrum thalictroides]
MASHRSNKDGPSSSPSADSVLPSTHTDCSKKDGRDSSSPSGRSSLSPTQLAAVRSNHRLWYRLRQDRLSTEPLRADHQPHHCQQPELTQLPIPQAQPRSMLTFSPPPLPDASNVAQLLPPPDMTAQLQHHLHSEARRLGISSTHLSLNSHTSSINIDFPEGSSSGMASAQLHEVNIFDINVSRDWTSFQFPVDVLNHPQDSGTLEIPVEVLQSQQGLFYFFIPNFHVLMENKTSTIRGGIPYIYDLHCFCRKHVNRSNSA